MSNIYNTQRPYAAAYMLFKNKKGEIAFVLRSKPGTWMFGHYGLPAGKVEPKETYTETAVRESREEVGATVGLKNLNHALTVHRFAIEGDGRTSEWVDILFEVKEWEGELYNAEPQKHSELAWFGPNNLPDNIIPADRASLKAIAEGKHYTEFGWEDAK